MRKRRDRRPPLRLNFGRWLTGRMAQKRGYDLANQLAVALGVPRERVSDWVLNVALPDASESAGLAAYLDVPLADVRTAQA